jgi:hypothetical protein
VLALEMTTKISLRITPGLVRRGDPGLTYEALRPPVTLCAKDVRPVGVGH